MARHTELDLGRSGPPPEAETGGDGEAAIARLRAGVAWKSSAPPWLIASVVLAVVGVAVSAYLTVVHYDQGALVCGVGDCHAVQASAYATIGAIPIALIGVGGYLAVGALGVARWRRPAAAWTLTLVAFGLAFGAVLYSAYLTYLEVAVIEAICQWCVASALTTLGLLAAETVGLVSLLNAPAEE